LSKLFGALLEYAAQDGVQQLAHFIPMDSGIKKIYFDLLFVYGYEEPQNIQLMIEFCKLVLKECPTDFNIKKVRDNYRLKTSKVYSAFYQTKNQRRESNLDLFFDELVKAYFITASNIIEIWHDISESLKGSETTFTKFLSLVKNKKKFVPKLENEEELTKMLTLRDFTRSQRSNPKLKSWEESFATVFDYLDGLIEAFITNSNKTSTFQQLSNPTILKKQTDQLQLNNIQPSTSKQALKETTKAKPIQSDEASKLSIFNENKLKTIQMKVGDLAKSERIKTIIKTLKQENVNAKQSEIRQVLEMFIEIAIQCLTTNQVKPYVEYVLNNIRGFIDPELLNKFLKSIILEQFMHVKNDIEVQILIEITTELHEKSKLSRATIVEIFGELVELKADKNLMRDLSRFVTKFEKSFTWKSLSRTHKKQWKSQEKESNFC
jgi:hypothetical protein